MRGDSPDFSATVHILNRRPVILPIAEDFQYSMLNVQCCFPVKQMFCFSQYVDICIYISDIYIYIAYIMYISKNKKYYIYIYIHG